MVHFLTAGTFLCHVKASKENSIELPCCGWITCTVWCVCELDGNYWGPQLCSEQVNLSEENVTESRNFNWDYNLTLPLRRRRICCMTILESKVKEIEVYPNAPLDGNFRRNMPYVARAGIHFESGMWEICFRILFNRTSYLLSNYRVIVNDGK